MRKRLLIEIGWILCALVLVVIQTSVLINWYKGLLFNIITVALVVLTITQKKRAIEIAFVAGVFMDVLSATPFGLHLSTYLLLILFLYVLTHSVFHTSVLYTVGLSTAIAIVVSTAAYRTVGALLLHQSLLQLWNSAALASLLWHGLIQGILATLALWLWQYQHFILRRPYGV